VSNRLGARLRWAFGLIGVAAVCLVIYTGHQALTAKDNLERVASDFTTLSGQLTSGDRAGVATTLADAQDHAAAARKNTRGPGWWLTERIPGVGPNVTAVRTVSDVVDELSRHVLPDVVTATSTLRPDNLRPHQGRVDLGALERIAPSVVAADRALQVQAGRIAAVRTGDLAPQIARPVTLMQDKMAEAASLSGRASRAVQLMPSMLGADGRRTYLMIFQNNAELRATGGIPGAFAVVHANHGKITIGAQGDAGTFGKLDRPALPVSAEEAAVFGPKIAQYAQDVTFTPHFPRSAELIRAMWKQRTGESVDGVVSTDPVALGYLLGGTGPVTIGGGRQLTSDNAVSVLLNRVYFEIRDPTLQNVYFAQVAKTVFGAVSGGRGDPQKVLSGLTRGADERRLLIWSAHPAEQKVLAGTELAGVLSDQAGDRPDLGVFMNDSSESKLDYYLDYATSVSSQGCQGGRQHLTVTVKLHSTVPADTTGMPDYVFNTGTGSGRGVIRLTVQSFLPVEGFLDGATVDGQDLSLPSQQLLGRKVVAQTLDVTPGQTRTLVLSVVSGRGQSGDPVLRTTPGARGAGMGHVGRSHC